MPGKGTRNREDHPSDHWRLDATDKEAKKEQLISVTSFAVPRMGSKFGLTRHGSRRPKE